jgi:hypothetical protein
MLRAAVWLFKNTRQVLYAALETHALDRLEVVGHSLGAGTAQLLTMLLDADMARIVSSSASSGSTPATATRRGPHCHAYAPPCVVSLQLAERFDHCISSYVFGNDLVCRLSCGHAMDLRSMLVAAVESRRTAAAAVAAARAVSGQAVAGIGGVMANLGTWMGSWSGAKPPPPPPPPDADSASDPPAEERGEEPPASSQPEAVPVLEDERMRRIALARDHIRETHHENVKASHPRPHFSSSPPSNHPSR